MEKLGLIQQLINEANNIDIPNLLAIVLLFYIPYRFSKSAETLFFHLLYSFFGVYMLVTMESFESIYNTKMLVGLGLLIPQINFIKYFTKDTIQTVKMMTANTYYFFVTIYYKILRFLNWIKSTFIMLKIFFTTFSFKKEDYYEQEQDSYYDNSHEEKSEKFYQEETSSKENYSYKQSQSKKEHTNNSSSKKSYFKQKDKIEHESTKYGRFSDTSAYVVLGVNPSDDFKTIKKAYRKLLREYHPDLNPNNIKKYTEITQLINNAYEKLEKYKK